MAPRGWEAQGEGSGMRRRGLRVRQHAQPSRAASDLHPAAPAEDGQDKLGSTRRKRDPTRGGAESHSGPGHTRHCRRPCALERSPFLGRKAAPDGLTAVSASWSVLWCPDLS